MSQNEAKTSKLRDDQFGNAYSPLYFDQTLSPNQFLPQLNGFKAPKSPKAQHRNASCNPYNQTLPVHEYVTLEFSNPIAVNTAKLVSRERKPIPIVDPETKQVMNASQLSLTKSSSQSNSIDLNEINKEVKYQVKQSQIPKSISLHIGRRDLPKNNQINAKTSVESAVKTSILKFIISYLS